MKRFRNEGRRGRRSIAIFGAAIAGLLVSAGSANADVVYDNIETPQPGTVVSQGFEATSTSELGGQVGLAGTDRQNPNITVLMVGFGCETGFWFSNDCTTTPGSGFSHPITMNIYDVGAGNSVGPKIASVTQTFQIPFRPSRDTVNCTGPDAGKWFSVADNACFNGFGSTIVFDLPSTLILPDNAIVSLAYNTSTHGYDPIGGAPCQTGPGGCGYDGLNVGIENATPAGPDVGSYPVPNGGYVFASNAVGYCDSGAGGLNTFRLDVETAPGCWTGFQPSISIDASPTAAGTPGPPGSTGPQGSVGPQGPAGAPGTQVGSGGVGGVSKRCKKGFKKSKGKCKRKKGKK